MMGWHYTLAELAATLGAPSPAAEATFSTISTDSRKIEPGQVFFALAGENFDGNRFVDDALARGAAAAVTCKSGDPRYLTVEDPLSALQRFAAAHRARFDIPVIAITGTCGKTTAKNMTAAVLATRFRTAKTQGNLNNNVGLPLSLFQLDAATECAVLEMGANHLGEIAELCAIARPTESAITLVGQGHLEGFGSQEGIARAKAEIAEALPKDGTFYVNTDNEWCRRIGTAHRGPKIYFGADGDVALRGTRFDDHGELELDIDPIGRITLPLPIRAHATNVLLAVAVGIRHGVREFEPALREACTAAARFKLRSIGPLTLLDDTYNANPTSMAAALEALADRPGAGQRIAALGDMLELGDMAVAAHAEIGTLAAERGIAHLFARGNHACDTINAARSAHAPHAEVIQDHIAIAHAIHACAAPGDTVLVKGSRGMQMEKVIEALAALYPVDERKENPA